MTVCQPSYQKLKGYIGLAIKSGSAVFGADNILKSKRLKLVLIDGSISENTMSKLIRYCEKNNITKLVLKDIPALTSREGCKAAAIKNQGLAEAVINSVTDADIS